MDMFGAPIPGQSLTREMGNAAFEQPPQYTKVEDVFRYYLERFEEDDIFQDMLYVFDQGMPIDLFVDSILLTGEQNGVHLFDMGFLVGPLLHEYMVGICIAGDVNYVEFQDEMDGARVDKAVEDFMNNFGGSSDALGDVADNLEEAQDMSEQGDSFSEGDVDELEASEEAMPMEDGGEAVDPAPEPPKGKGLMGRPNV